MTALHKFNDKLSLLNYTSQKNSSNFESKVTALRDYLNNLDSTKISFEESEKMIVKLTYEIGQVSLSESLQKYDISADAISIGGQTYRQSQASPRVYQTSFGSVEVVRHLYRDRTKGSDRKNICPLELQAGIIDSYWTPGAAKKSIWALSHLTPQETEGLFLQTNGMDPSRSSLERLPKTLSSKWEPHTISHHEQLMHSEKIPDNAKAMAISLDGVMVAMKPKKPAKKTALTTIPPKAIKPATDEIQQTLEPQGEASHPENTSLRDLDETAVKAKKTAKKQRCEWREASCGTVSFFDESGERLSTIQYARMPEQKKATLKTLLQSHVEYIQNERPDLDLIHLADGAQDNWTFFDERLPLGFQLVDFYHASEYLKQAFDAAYPNDESKAKSQYDKYYDILQNNMNGAALSLRALRYLRDKNKHNDAIKKSVTYFTNNQHRMKYAQARAMNYPIGSGIVEAACKSLVAQRVKRSGMSWYHQGGQAILNFRSLIKSDRFDKAWEIVAEHYKKAVKICENVVNLPVQELS